MMMPPIFCRRRLFFRRFIFAAFCCRRRAAFADIFVNSYCFRYS